MCQEKAPLCEECDVRMERYEDALDTGRGGWRCPRCAWSWDDEDPNEYVWDENGENPIGIFRVTFSSLDLLKSRLKIAVDSQTMVNFTAEEAQVLLHNLSKTQ